MRRSISETPISLAHLTVLDASPPELVALAHEAGCDLVGLRLLPVTETERPWPLVSDKALVRETVRQMTETGVRVLDVELVKVTPELVVSQLEPLLATAEELGAQRVLTQIHDPDLGRAGQRYGALCELAGKHGLTCDIEFLTWTGVRDVATAARFIAGVGHARSGLCIDTLHFARSNCAPEEIENLPPQWLHYAQVSDGPATPPSTEEGLIAAAREHRLLPGEGAIPLAEIIVRLPAEAPLALEIPNAQLARELTPQARVSAAVAALRGVLEQVEALRASRGGGPHERQRGETVAGQSAGAQR